jgi:hypothetical protein
MDNLTVCKEEFDNAQKKYEEARRVMHEASEELTIVKRKLDAMLEDA